MLVQRKSKCSLSIRVVSNATTTATIYKINQFHHPFHGENKNPFWEKYKTTLSIEGKDSGGRNLWSD